MGTISIGYGNPIVEFRVLSNGSKAWQVRYEGDRAIIFECVDRDAADILASVINHSVVHTEVT